MMRYSSQKYPHHLKAAKTVLELYHLTAVVKPNGAMVGPYSPWIAYLINQLVRYLESGKGTRRQRTDAARHLVKLIDSVSGLVLGNDNTAERTNLCEKWTRYRDKALLILPIGTRQMTPKLKHYYKILQRLEREAERGSVDLSRNIIFRHIAQDVLVEIQALVAAK